MTNGEYPVRAHQGLLLSAGLVLFCSACDGEGESTNEEPVGGVCPAPEEPLLGSTPPVTLADCEPPSPVSRALEMRVAAADEAAEMRSAQLFDTQQITVVMCGTGTPVPSDRAQSCTAVFAGGQFLLFDAGDGAARSIEALGLPVEEIDGIFLTHFHSDHMADVGEVVSRSWILGRTDPVTVYGGPGIDRVMDGFNSIYALDDAYRHEHHGDSVFPVSSSAADAVRIDDPGSEGQVVYEQGGVRVEAFSVDHSPILPAYGYRISFGGRSVGISGDSIDTPGLRSLARQADVLVAEVLQRDLTVALECAFRRQGDERNAKLNADIQTYHIGPDELGRLAESEGVQTLVLTHQVPVIDDPDQAEMAFGTPVRAEYGGEVILAADGTEILVPITQ